jgi:hypothetical protein
LIRKDKLEAPQFFKFNFIQNERREWAHLIRKDKLEARQFFKFNFKGTPSQDQQKTLRRRLITFKVTLTDQRINSVK